MGDQDREINGLGKLRIREAWLKTTTELPAGNRCSSSSSSSETGPASTQFRTLIKPVPCYKHGEWTPDQSCPICVRFDHSMVDYVRAQERSEQQPACEELAPKVDNSGDNS